MIPGGLRLLACVSGVYCMIGPIDAVRESKPSLLPYRNGILVVLEEHPYIMLDAGRPARADPEVHAGSRLTCPNCPVSLSSLIDQYIYRFSVSTTIKATLTYHSP